MLEVHVPHNAAHTWRDFFIHIATIVVGLLIAVGLEQAVERIHEYYELRETREALDGELRSNRENLAANERSWLSTFAMLSNNLQLLDYIRRHPGTAQTALPGDLRWSQHPFIWNHAVWDAALTRGLVRLLPPQEANRHLEFYGLMSVMGVQSLSDWDAINDAHRFDLLDNDPTHLSPPRLDEVILQTENALSKHIQLGYSFGRYANEYPELAHAITWEKINRLRPAPMAVDPKAMAAAHQQTDDRIDAAIAAFNHQPGVTQTPTN